MSRLWLAIRAFFRVLFDAQLAHEVQRLFTASDGPPAPTAKSTATRSTPSKASPDARSDALTLLAALQREARLIDFVQEPIDAYSDAQVGSAVREVHRQCAAVFERHFALVPILQDEEGNQVEVPREFDAARLRLTGNVVGQAPHRGKLVHHGWQAAKCELPTWTGGAEAARVVAPAEVEVG